MKKTIAIVCALGLAAGALFAGCGADKAAAPAPKKERVLTVGADINYPPFEFEENGKPVGFDIELGEAIAEKMGAKLEVKNVVFGDLITAVKENKIDAILSGFEGSEERGKLLTFTDAYMPAGYSVVTLKDDNEVKDWADLSGKIVGTQTGTRHTELSIDFGAKRVQAFEEKDNVVKALEAKKVEAIVVDTPVALYYVKHNDKLKIVGEPKVSKTGLVLAVKKGNTELQKELNDALAAVKADGTYDKIYAEWFGKQ